MKRLAYEITDEHAEPVASGHDIAVRPLDTPQDLIAAAAMPGDIWTRALMQEIYAVNPDCEEGGCTFCMPWSPEAWANVRASQAATMREYDVDWDPTLTL